jgi:hypothetical protein
MHVYHYAHYEVTALKRLMGMHGTREEEVDDLLRNEVFVDLYKVVRQGLRISQPSYSIKKVEVFYMEPRDTSVTDGEDSIVAYERSGISLPACRRSCPSARTSTHRLMTLGLCCSWRTCSPTTAARTSRRGGSCSRDAT